jgi:Uma2 family endonuclease
MSASRKPTDMTVAEFLAWDSGDDSGALWQLIDGVPHAMAPASEPHGAIQLELGALIRNHLLATGSPCRIIGAPGVVPKFRSAKNCRVPDLGVTCAPPARGQILTDPVLLIEILSPSNRPETWANVWTYTTIPTVTEILIVSSTRIAADLLRRDAAGGWPDEAERIEPGGTLELRSIGLRLPLADLYRTSGVG